MRYVLLFLATVSLAGCGEDEKTPCEKLMDVHKTLCEGAEECFPCVCPLCNMGWAIPERLGLPDIENSSCTESEPCEGNALAHAEVCLPHAPSGPDEMLPPQVWLDNDCDPRYSRGVWICGNDGTFAFPDALSKGIEWKNCGR